MDHLAEAEEYAKCANLVDGEMFAQLNAQLATAHAAIAQAEQAKRAADALITIAERLPPPAETWSEGRARLRQEDRAWDHDRPAIHVDIDRVQGVEVSSAYITGDSDGI